MRPNDKGLTLIELMVVLAIVAILASLAVPSFRDQLLRRSVQAAANALVSDFNYARTEAIKRGRPVSIACRTDAANGVCLFPAGGVPTTWGLGWVVYVPTLGNGSFTAGDLILKRHEAPKNIASIGAAGIPQYVSFLPTGLASRGPVVPNMSLAITPVGVHAATLDGLVCVSVIGRASIRPMGTAACIGS